MPDKRLVYFTSSRVTAYLWHRGTLRKESAFSFGDEGVAQFSKYVAGAPDSLFYVLADIVEEDFFHENIPYVRGRDRRALLARKLAQRYRDTTLAIALSLGSETVAGRREERILYTSFTNTQQFQPWLAAFRANQAKVVGVYSVPLASPMLGKRIGFKAPRYLIVSRQQAGLRQTYIENDRIRFSRLTRAEVSTPGALAEEFAKESNHVQEYLVNSRILPREAPPLDVLVLAPSEHKALYDAACVNSAKLQFHVYDLDKVGHDTGLKAVPPDTLAEGLFLHTLANSQGGEQFADDAQRRFYHLWRARVGLMTAGAGVFAFCLVFSGVKLLDIYKVDQSTELDRQQESMASQEYARMQASFPKMPTSTESLKTVVKNYGALLRQSASPEKMFVEISKALAAVPQIELEKIDWEIGGPKAPAGRESSKAPPASTPFPAPAPANPDVQLEVAEISGKLNLPQSSDYRAIAAIVNQFTEALRRQPGIEVVGTRLPFDVNTDKSITGDIGAQRSEDVPRFSVTVSKRLGT